MNKYKWDSDQISYCTERLKLENDNLDRYRNELRTFKEDVAAAWRSLAGSEYSNNLEINHDLLQQIISSLDDEILKLTEVIKKCYEPCEAELHSTVQTLASNIKIP